MDVDDYDNEKKKDSLTLNVLRICVIRLLRSHLCFENTYYSAMWLILKESISVVKYIDFQDNRS